MIPPAAPDSGARTEPLVRHGGAAVRRGGPATGADDIFQFLDDEPDTS